MLRRCSAGPLGCGWVSFGWASQLDAGQAMRRKVMSDRGCGAIAAEVGRLTPGVGGKG